MRFGKGSVGLHGQRELTFYELLGSLPVDENTSLLDGASVCETLSLMYKCSSSLSSVDDDASLCDFYGRNATYNPNGYLLRVN